MISFTGIFLKILQNYPKLSLTIYLFSGKYLSGICLVGEMSVGHLSGWGNVLWAFVWSGKCPSGMCLVGEVSVREESVGDESGNHLIFFTYFCHNDLAMLYVYLAFTTQCSNIPLCSFFCFLVCFSICILNMKF